MKRLLLFFSLAIAAIAQNAYMLPWTPQQFTNTNGTLLVSGKVCTYLAGTSTGTATFTDSTASVQNAIPPNAILLDSTARPTSGGIWLTPNKAYKIVSMTAGSDGTCNTGVVVKTQDNVVTNAGGSLTANNAFTGINTFKDINHQKQLDGTTYPLTGSGFQQAVTDCIADALCSEVDAMQLGVATTTTTTSLTKPMLVRIGSNTAITGGAGANPVICYSSSVSIDGGMGEGANGSIAAFKSATAANEIIAPCTPSSQTNNFTARGVDFWNTNAAATGTVVDLTNCRYCSLGPNTRVQKSGGSASLVLVTTTGGLSDFFNDYFNVVLQGNDGNGRGFDFENAANAQSIFGGEVESVADPVYCNGGAGVLKTNNISLHGTQFETWTGSAFHLVQNCSAIRAFNVRLEASNPATWFNIGATGTADVQDFGSFHAGTFTYGIDQGIVSLWGCSANCSPGPAVEGAIAHTLQSAVFSGVGGSQGPSVFSQSVSGQDIVNFTSDAFANSANGVLFTGQHAGGSTWRFAPDQFGLDRYSFRCISGCSAGQPAWSLATAATGSFEGILSHTNTATRTYTFPDNTGTVPELNLAQTWTATQTLPSPVITGTVPTYNGSNTAGQGLVPVLCATSQRTESAPDNNLLTCAIPAQAGSYRIRFFLATSAANAATLGWTLSYTDSNGNPVSPVNQPEFTPGTAGPALTFTTSAAQDFYGSTEIDVNNAGTAIVVKLTFSGTSFTGKASATVERII